MSLDFTTTLYLPNPDTLQLDQHQLNGRAYPSEEVLSRLGQCKAHLGRQIKPPLRKLAELQRFTELFAAHLQHSPQPAKGIFAIFRSNPAAPATQLASDFALLLQTKEHEVLMQIQNHLDHNCLSYDEVCDLIQNASPTLASWPQFQSLFDWFKTETAKLLNTSQAKSTIELALKADASLSWLKTYLDTNPTIHQLETIEPFLLFYPTSDTIPEGSKILLRCFLTAQTAIKAKIKPQLNTLYNAAWQLCNLHNDSLTFVQFFSLLQSSLSITSQDAIQIVMHFLSLDQSLLAPNCIHKLFAYTDHDWIGPLIEKQPPQPLIKQFLTAASQALPATTSHEIFLRAAQIHQAATSTLPSICLQLAYTIETQFVHTFSFTPLYYPPPDPRIAQSVIVLPDGAVALLSEQTRTLSDGTSKMVHEGILLPYQRQQKAKTIAISHNRERVEVIKREAYLYRLFSQKPGIWPLLDVCESGDKVYLLMERADGDLKTLLECDLELPTTTLILILKQLLSGLHTIHKENHIHNDIKLRNLLYRLPDMAGIIDFAECCPTNRFHTTAPGYYGSILPTSPEFWGQTEFSGDPFKVEMWALGYTLYQFIFNQGTRWDNLLHTAYIQGTVIDEYNRNQFRTLVREDIEVPLAALLAKPTHTIEERIVMLVFKLMRLDPEARLDSSQALAEITEIYTQAK